MDIYTIAENDRYGSREVSFDAKPQAAVIAALKALKMRWNPKRSIWYGFADEKAISDAIKAAQPESVPAQVVTDGYLGGGAVAGAKSDRCLYGSELSAAIRADIKAAGIKGVSIRCSSYSGGQSISATVTATAADLVSEAEYIANYRPSPAQSWVYFENGACMHTDDYFKIWNAQACGHGETYIPEIQQRAGRDAYITATEAGQHNINQYHINKYTEYKPDFLRKLERVAEIINNYRYDNSNSMVDYFDTNFYYNISTKIKEA